MTHDAVLILLAMLKASMAWARTLRLRAAWLVGLLMAGALCLGAASANAQTTGLPAIASPYLSVAELVVERGAVASFQVLLPGPASTAQTYVLTSSNSDVLTVPSRVTLPVGARSVEVPVSARAPGLAMVRVLGPTRQLALTVRVIEGASQLQSLQPLPATVPLGGQALVRIELTASVRDGAILRLASMPTAALDLPVEVQVAAGARAVDVPVRALQQGVHKVLAEFDGHQLDATIRVTDARLSVVSVTPAQATLEVGATTDLTVQMSGHAASVTDVSLTTSPAGVVVAPAAVSVPAGADRAVVEVKAVQSGTAQVLAEFGAGSRTSTITVRPPAGAAVLPNVTLRPATLSLQPGATASVVVETDAVRAYDQVIALSVLQSTPAPGSAGAVVQLAPSVVLRAGQRSTTFQVTAAAVGNASVGLRMLNTALTVPLVVDVSTAEVGVASVSPPTQSIPLGSVGKATVRVSPGARSDAIVDLSVDDAGLLSVPTSVRIAAGRTEADVALAARAEGETRITASLNGRVASSRVVVTPPEVEELRPVNPFRIGLGNTQALPLQALMTDGSVVDAPQGWRLVSDKPEVVRVNADGSVTGLKLGEALLTLSWGQGDGIKKWRLSVIVETLPRLSLSPAVADLVVGSSLTYTLSSTVAAPSTGLPVTLEYSGEGNLGLPTGIAIAPGAMSVAFDASALSAGQVFITASASGRQSASATLNKLALTLRIDAASPQKGPAGTVVTLTGQGFDPVVGNNQVLIDQVPVEVVAASARQIAVRVPVQAVTGVVSVKNSLGVATGPTFTVEQAQDASIELSPNAVQLLRGSEATSALMLANLGTQPYTGSMALTVSGLPNGVSAVLDPQSLPAERSGTLRLLADDNVVPGSYTVRITGVGPSTSGRITRVAVLTVTVPNPDVLPSTGVRGRFLTPAGKPIAGVIVRADVGGQSSPTISTDSSGAFQLAGLPAGNVTLRFDATPANPLYPIWPFNVTVLDKQMLLLKDFVISPPPEAQTFSTINNTVQDQKVTDERFPGLEITLPAGAEIVGWDGVKKTKIAVEKRDISELPVVPPPVPTGTAYQLYFGTPMGGIPSKPIPVTLPNDSGAEPGESVNVWFFDGSPLGGTGEWKIAGQATVSADGKTARMTSGGLTRFCGVCGLACLQRNPEGDKPGKGCPKASDGNPVNLFSGQELTRTGGMRCGGLTPVETGRNYNPIDAFNNIGGTEGSVGYGWALDYDVMFLTGSVKRLVLPGNVDHVFGDEGNGTYRNRDEPGFDGAAATAVGNGWQLVFKDGTTWKFQPFAGAPGNVKGQPQFLTEIVDSRGVSTSISRNARGQFMSAGSGSRRISATYGSSGFIEKISDPEGRTERYTYTSTNRIETVTDPDGRATRYSYVSDSQLPSSPICSAAFRRETGERLKTITYPGLTNPTENHYGSSRRILRQTTAEGTEFRFKYRVSGACITHVSRPGCVGPGCSSGGAVATSGSASGGVGISPALCIGADCPTEDSWESFQAGWRFHGGQVLSTTVERPDGTKAITRFGSEGQVLEVSESGGDRLQYTRDANNRATRITDTIGRVSRMVYDDKGNVTRSIDPLGRFTDITYDSRWNKPATITRYADDGTAQTWRFTFDAKGNLATTTDPLGNKSTLAYSALGQLTSLTDALGQTTRMAYSAAGDLAKLTDPLNNSTQLATDGSGRPTSTTDALGYTTNTQTNGIGQTTQVEDAIGGKTLMVYDEGARLKSVTNPRGHAIATYSYDVYGRLTARTDAAGKADSYTYDSAGRVSTVTDRKGQTTRYSYDSAGRVVSIEFPDRTRNLTFDGAGRVVTVEEGGSRVDYSYDTVDRLVKEVQTTNATSHEVSYAYDRLDRRVSRQVNGADETRYEWDIANRLKAIRFAGESTLYDWDAAGRLTRKTLPNGVTADYAYDAASRLLGITYKKPGGAQIEKIDYSYDARGMRISKALATGGVIADTPMTATYDAADRMTEVRFTATGETCALAYDANGSLTTKDCGAGKVSTYSWDGLNRLVGIQGPGVEASFAYDVMGRRTARTVNGVTTAYVYDGVQAIGEVVNGERTQLLTGLAIDEAIATYSTGKARYALTDALGSVLAEMRADGSQASGQAFSVYGEVKASGEAVSAANGYTGRENDGSGAYFYRARHYDPVLKRFVSEDPIGLQGGPNRYAYVGGAPASLTDPSGEVAPLVIAAAVWIVGGAVEGGLIDYGLQRLLGGECDATDWGSVGVNAAIGAALGPGVSSAVRGAGAKIAARQAAKRIANPVPATMARVIPSGTAASMLGRPGASDVFVTGASDIAGMNSKQIAQRLTIPESATGFTVIEFPAPTSGIASPVFRGNPGFVGGGRTAGGAREFVIPNGPIPDGSIIRIVP